MRDLRIFYLRVCVMLFISVQFSNAGKMKITNPTATFAYTASIHSLLVKGPNQSNFTQHSPAKPMFLAVHQDTVTLSFYEVDAPYTLLTFPQRSVDFEILYAETMIFNVTEESGVWHFRCVFSADRETLDIIFAYLSICTGKGSMAYRMDINCVERYVKMDHMKKPIVEPVKDLQPALLYDQQVDDKFPLKKIYSVTVLAPGDTERRLTRLVFRTDKFKASQVNTVVVMKFTACNNWYYLFHFLNTKQARRFIRNLAPFEILDVPPDVVSYVEVGSPYFVPTTQNESESDSKESQPGTPTRHNDQPSQSQHMAQASQPSPFEHVPVTASFKELEDERSKEKRQRVSFTPDQVNRLRMGFDECHHPSKQEREELGSEIGLTEVQIKNWFKNQRDKLHSLK